jgi:GTP cyclohydrolase II
VLLRVQDSCLTGEVFGSVRCDCRQQLDASLARLQREAALQHALGRRRRRRSEDAARSRPFDTGRVAAELEVIASAAAGDGAGALPEGSDSGQRVVGLVVYLMQEGRGIGIVNKLRAYELQDRGMDTVEANLALGFQADLRDYGLGAQVLADLGLRRLRLMTNNPKKVSALQGYGLEIVDHVPIVAKPNPERERYMATKRDKMDHMLP